MLTPETLTASVLAVPPLARNRDLSLNREENRRLIRHIEAGGVRTLLYGGNANLYHVSLNRYTELLQLLSEIPHSDTIVIPSVGPAFGTMLEQAALLRNFDFPTVMVLPPPGISTSAGIFEGVSKLAEAYGKPILLYIKQEDVITVQHASKLVADGAVTAIKYAIVRVDPVKDDYLSRLVDEVDSDIIISGMGEQPTLVHFEKFGIKSFTSGCVCIAPALSMQMLQALSTKDWEKAERIKKIFEPLENLRNRISPIRILHEAVTLAGIADTGPLLPLLSNLEAEHRDAVRDAALSLLRKAG